MGKRNKKKNKMKNQNQQDNNFNNNNNVANNSSNNQNDNLNNNENQPNLNQPNANQSPKDVVHFAEQIEKPQSTKKTILTFLIALILALALTFIILFSTGLLDKNDLNILSLVSGDDSWTNITQNLEMEETDEEIKEKLVNFKNNGDSDITESNYMFVRIPTLLGPQYDNLRIDGKKVNCDTIWWVKRIVPYTKAPLNATYREMFSFDQELDFYSGNYVNKLENLSFDYATIENRIAKVYLQGEIETPNNECDKTRLQTQIHEAALQFETVDDVLIYLNNELL